MKFPSSIKVGAITYTVTDNDEQVMKFEHREKKSGHYGYTDNLNAMIYINPTSAPPVKRLTLLHEVMHACTESMMGAPDWRALGKDKDDREESVIRAWESPLLQVIRDNPDLIAYLAQDDDTASLDGRGKIEGKT